MATNEIGMARVPCPGVCPTLYVYTELSRTRAAERHPRFALSLTRHDGDIIVCDIMMWKLACLHAAAFTALRCLSPGVHVSAFTADLWCCWLRVSPFFLAVTAERK